MLKDQGARFRRPLDQSCGGLTGKIDESCVLSLTFRVYTLNLMMSLSGVPRGPTGFGLGVGFRDLGLWL